MKKVISIICLVGFMFMSISCDQDNSTGVKISGSKSYKTICIDGVEYLKRTQGYGVLMAPHFKQDGSLYLCE